MKNIQIATKEQMIAIQLAMTDMQQNMNSFIEHTSQINQSIIQRLFKSLLTKTLGGVKHIALVPEISKHKREPTNWVETVGGEAFGQTQNRRRVTESKPIQNASHADSGQTLETHIKLCVNRVDQERRFGSTDFVFGPPRKKQYI